ncbi:MAG: hypothetical protein GC154_15925 [bacterium]|nr:hypothetical protein [bacterium]
MRKIYHLLKEHWGRDDQIITADDDVIYPSTWIERLCAISNEYPDHRVCFRGKLITKGKRYRDWPDTAVQAQCVMPRGREGVLYRPQLLMQGVLDVNRYLALCPLQDDIWLHAHSRNRGNVIVAAADSQEFMELPTRVKLWPDNVAIGNDRAIAALEQIGIHLLESV